MEQVTCPSCQNRIPLKIIPLKKTFEQSTDLIDTSSSNLDSINFSISGLFAGLVVFIFSWWYQIELAGILVSATALGTGIGLHVLKIWLHRPIKEASKQTNLRIEHIDKDKRHWLIDELQCNVSLDKITSLSRKLESENWKWSRRLVTSCNISQTKCNHLRDSLLRLNYLKPLPNNQNGYEMTWRGKRTFISLLNTKT